MLKKKLGIKTIEIKIVDEKNINLVSLHLVYLLVKAYIVLQKVFGCYINFGQSLSCSQIWILRDLLSVAFGSRH